MSTQSFKCLIHGANEVVTVATHGKNVLCGAAMRELSILKKTNGTEGFSIVVDSDGKICAIGKDSDINSRFPNVTYQHSVNAAGLCVLPGFVDAHTHPVWAGDRVHEFGLKLAGATYMEVLAAGGGILFTAEHTRQASEQDLLLSFADRANQMLKSGTTVLEAKSGYCLDPEGELKMLRVLEKAKAMLPIEIASTFCGAHAVPKDSTAEKMTKSVIEVQLPMLKQEMDAGRLHVENVDVFCDKGIFDLDQTRRILQAGHEMGLAMNFHGDELYPMHAAELAGGLKARAVSHLEAISDAGIASMAENGVIGILLPTTAYMLRLQPPPARKMIEAGIAVALGSDFNANAYCYSMPIVMHLACVLLKLSMEEALVAATQNAAASLGRAQTHGSIEVGKFADLVFVDAPRWEHVIYQYGCADKLIKYVMKRGDIVHARTGNPTTKF